MIPPGVATPGIPLSLTALPDGRHFLALDPPDIDVINQKTVVIGDTCSALSVDLELESSTNLGLGDFTPVTMLVSR